MPFKRPLTIFTTALLLLTLAVPTLAQRGRGGTDRPPIDLSHLPELPQFDLPDLPDDLGEWTIPEAWADITLPESLPTTVDELEAWLAQYESLLELELANFKPVSNPDAAAVVSGFASTYMAASVAPIYAGTISANSSSTADIQQVVAAMPSEIQNMMTIVAMMQLNGFWGIFNDGFGVISSDIPCDSDACSIDLGRAQLTIEEASVGLLVLYRPIVVSDAPTAQSLLISAYPALASYEMTAIESEAGFIFSAVDLNPETPVGYIAGVITEGDQSLVFATAIVGEGMVSMVNGG